MKTIPDNGGRWYAKLAFDGGSTYDDYDGGTAIHSVSVTAYAQSGEELAIGCTVSACVTVKMEAISGLQGQTLSLYLGQETEGTAVWYPMGVYTVTETAVQDGVLTFTARDAMYFLEGAYTPSAAVQGACTLAAALSDLCAQTGAVLASDVPDVSFGGMPGNLTYASALGYLAALAGCNARFDREGKLVLSWYTDSGVTLTADDYYSGGLTVKLADITVCSLTVTVESSDGDGGSATIQRTTENTGEGISVTNPLFTESNVETAWSVVQGFVYRPATVSAVGQPGLEPGDVAAVTQDGNTWRVPVMCHTLDYDGGLKSTITAEGTCAAEQVNRTGGGPLAQQMKQLKQAAQAAAAKALTVHLSSEYQGIPCAADGSMESLPTVQTAAAAQYGSTDVTADCAWSLTETGCSGSWDAESHTYTLTALSGDSASAEITATYQGVSVSKTFSLTKIYGGSNGADAILLHIGSSRGTTFKNNTVSTVLSVTVYRGSQTITDITALREALGDTAALNWSFQRFSSDTIYTIDPADTRISGDGFCFTVSPDDVDATATFFCTLTV